MDPDQLEAASTASFVVPRRWLQLCHTRLRIVVEVREETIADILWHTRAGMTARYSVAQVAERVKALNRITDERHRTNQSLAMIARDALRGKSPQKVPMQMKNG